jgi:hypothetical protein
MYRGLMKEDRPNPCLSLLKDHQYCDFYEAVYLFGCDNLNKLNDRLKVAYIDPETKDIKSISGFNESQRDFVLRRVMRYEHTIDFGTSSFPSKERLNSINIFKIAEEIFNLNIFYS